MTHSKGGSKFNRHEHYQDCIYRFDALAGFFECSGTWEKIDVNGVTVPTMALADFVRAQDTKAVETLGVVNIQKNMFTFWFYEEPE
jgi:hypothetical protein